MGAHVVKHLLGEYVAWFISNTRCVCESFFDLHLHAHTAHLQALQSDTTSLADHEDDLQDHQGEDENGDQGEDEGEDEAENDESGAFGGNNVRDPSADPFAESEAGVRVDADDSEQGFRKVRGRSGSRRGRGRGGRGGASSRGRPSLSFAPPSSTASASAAVGRYPSGICCSGARALLRALVRWVSSKSPHRARLRRPCKASQVDVRPVEELGPRALRVV